MTARIAVVGLDMPARRLQRSTNAAVLTGALAGAASAGFDVRLSTYDSGPVIDQLAEFVDRRGADAALILTSGAIRPPDVAPLRDAGLPFVLVDRHFEHDDGAPAVDCVGPDWTTAAREAVERLYAYGHRRAVALIPDDETSSALDQRRGWREGVSRCGLAVEDAPVLSEVAPEMGIDTGRELGRDLFRHGLPGSGERPTMVVAFDDDVAYGVLQAAHDAELVVPEQVSIIGFGDTISRYLSPPMCTHDPHAYDIGVHAIARLATLLNAGSEDAARTAKGPGATDAAVAVSTAPRAPDPDPRRPRRLTLPVDFVPRATCAPLL